MTTNRVGSFDDAFVSRIHVVIKYDKLGLEDRRKIWEQFFDKLEEERDDFVIASRAKDYVLADEVISKVEWNGREIRNSKCTPSEAHENLGRYPRNRQNVYRCVTT